MKRFLILTGILLLTACAEKEAPADTDTSAPEAPAVVTPVEEDVSDEELLNHSLNEALDAIEVLEGLGVDDL